MYEYDLPGVPRLLCSLTFIDLEIWRNDIHIATRTSRGSYGHFLLDT